MAERVTKSYADKIDELNQRIEKLQQNASAFYPKAGDVLFSVLEARDLEDLKAKWNKLVPKDMKVDKLECDVEIPILDQTLAMSNRKMFATLLKDFMEASEVQKAVAGEVLSTVLHVSVLGDLNNKLRELGLLNDGVVDEVEEETEEEETVEEVSLEEVLASDETMKHDDATDSSTWNPYA